MNIMPTLDDQLGFVPDAAKSDDLGFVPDLSLKLELDARPFVTTDYHPSQYGGGVPPWIAPADNPDAGFLKAVAKDAVPAVKYALNNPVAKGLGIGISTVGKIGSGMVKSGLELATGNPDLAKREMMATGDAFSNPAGREPEESPWEQGRQSLPLIPRAAAGVASGLIESAPQLAISAVDPIAGAASFGFTPDGFDPVQAGTMLIAPAGGRILGRMAENVAAKAGITTDKALQTINRVGGATGISSIISAPTIYKISQMPAGLERDKAIEDAGANAILIGLFGALGDLQRPSVENPVKQAPDVGFTPDEPKTNPEPPLPTAQQPTPDAAGTVRTPDGRINPLEMAINKLRQQSKETAAVPVGEPTNAQQVGEQSPPGPPVAAAEPAPALPTIAEKAAAAPSAHVTLADLAQLQAEMRGNQLKPSEPKPAEPATAETSPPAEATAPASAAVSDFDRYQQLTQSLKAEQTISQPEVEAAKNAPVAEPPAMAKASLPEQSATASTSQVAELPELYHGTRGTFEHFDLKHAGKSDEGLLGKAVYFSPTESQARDYATNPRYGGNVKGTPRVITANVKLENPIIIQDGKLPDGRRLTDLHPKGITKQTASAINRELVKRGYDGAIFKIGDEVTQVAVFDPTKIEQKHFETSQSDKAASGTAPGQSATRRNVRPFIRPRPDGIHDILDEVQSQGGIRSPESTDIGGEYDAHKEAMKGTAAMLRRKNGGLRPDDMVKAVQENFPRIQTPDDLYQAIKSAVKQRQTLKENGGGHDAQSSRFWNAVSQPENAKGVEKINVDQLNVGQTFRIKSPGITHDEMTVTHLDPNTGEVTVKDGPNFGQQDLPEGAEIYIRKGSLVKPQQKVAAVPKLRPGEKGTGSLLQSDEPFNLAGERGTDAERIAKQKAEAEATKKADAEFQTKAHGDLFQEKANKPVNIAEQAKTLSEKFPEEIDEPVQPQPHDNESVEFEHEGKNWTARLKNGAIRYSDEAGENYAERQLEWDDVGNEASYIEGSDNDFAGEVPDDIWEKVPKHWWESVTDKTDPNQWEEYYTVQHNDEDLGGWGNYDTDAKHLTLKAALEDYHKDESDNKRLVYYDATKSGYGRSEKANFDVVTRPSFVQKLLDAFPGMKKEEAQRINRGRNPENEDPYLVAQAYARHNYTDYESKLKSAKENSGEEHASDFERNQARQEIKDVVDAQMAKWRREKVENEQGKTTISEKANKLADSLESLKTGITKGGQLHAFGIPALIWDKAIELAQAVIRKGGSIADAITAAIDHIKANHKGEFEEDKARFSITQAMQKESSPPDRERSLHEVKADYADAEAALKEATKTKEGQSQKEYKQQAAIAAARYRSVRDELKLHPDRIAEVLKESARLSREAKAARDAGDNEKSRELEDDMQHHADDLARLPVKMVARIRDELISRGELPKEKPLIESGAGRTLDEMTRRLNGSKEFESPKVPLLERLAIGKRIAEGIQGVKDAFHKAVANTSAAWKAGVESMKHPPVDDDYRAAKKSWIAYDQQTDIENMRYAKALVDKVPSSNRRKAMSVWLDAQGDKSLLEYQRQNVPDEYRPVWDAALKLTADEQNTALDVKRNFELKAEDSIKTGLMEKEREDYGVPQVWKNPPQIDKAPDAEARKGKPGNPNARLDTRDPFFSFQRQTPTYFDGIMAGGKPKNLDLAHLVTVYDSAFHKALGSRGWVGALQESQARDGQPVVKISGSASTARGENGDATFVNVKSAGKDAVTADGRPYRSHDHPALKDWKFVSKDAAGNPILVKGDMLIHPDYYGDVKNELETPRWTRKLLPGETRGTMENLGYGALKTSAFLKSSKFIGPFHIVTEALHSIFHGIVPTVHGFDLDLKDAQQARLARNMTLGFGKAREMFEEGLGSHGGIWGHVPGLGQAITRLNNFTFNEYIPKLKMKVGLAVLNRNDIRYAGKLSSEQIAELTGRQMDAAFGGQNWRLMGTNKNTLAFMRLGLVAPDFLISRSKVIGQALKPYNKEQRVFLLAQAAGVYLLARTLNTIFSDDHDPHFELKNWDRVVIGKRAYGARFIVSDAANLARDLLGLGSFNQHGIPFITGRLGVVPKIGMEAMTGKDLFTGQDKDSLFHTDSPILKAFSTVLKDAAEWMTPMGVDGFLPGAEAKGVTGAGQALTAFAGISSRKNDATGEVWDLARKFNLNSSDPKAVQFQKNRDSDTGRPSDYRALNNLLDAGDTAKAQKAYDELIRMGRTDQQIAAHYDRNVSFTGNLDREGLFLKSLTPEQQKIYKEARDEQKARQMAFKALAR